RELPQGAADRRGRGAGQARRLRARDVIACTFEDGRRAALRHVVVHAVVEQHGTLLLVKRAGHLLEGGKWGLPGVFLDRDETLAVDHGDTVRAYLDSGRGPMAAPTLL